MSCSERLGASIVLSAIVDMKVSIGNAVCMDLSKLHILINLRYQALPDEA